MRLGIEFEGFPEAQKKVRSLLSAVEASQVEKILQRGAQRISDRAKTLVAVPDGLLKRSLKAKIGKRRGALRRQRLCGR